MSSNINILHVVSDLLVSRGGQQNATYWLAHALSRKAGSIGILFGSKLGRAYGDGSLGNSNLSLFGVVIKNLEVYKKKYRTSISSVLDRLNPEIVHLHGMWLPIYALAFMVARSYQKKVVISPHGTLSPWDLARKGLKKKLALRLYQLKVLKGADLFIVASLSEAEGIRKLALDQPIAVVPVGVPIPILLDDYYSSFAGATKIALYMGRIHPGKGLLDLIEAWRNVGKSGWLLNIAGPAVTPEELSYLEIVRKKIKIYGLDQSIILSGMLEGDEKELAFRSAKLFILPTYSENFGIVVAEALSYSVPVITTTGAPWKELEDYGCGWWVSPGQLELSKALRYAINMDPSQLMAMGLRGRDLAVQKYSWETVAQMTLDAYEWILNQETQTKPTFIF